MCSVGIHGGIPDQRAVARELGHARNTVAKAMANPIPPGYRLAKRRPKPKIDPVKPIIDA